MNFQTTLIKFSASFCFKFGFGREKKKKNTRKRSIQFIPSEYHSEISTEIEHFKEMSYIVKEVFKYYCCNAALPHKEALWCSFLSMGIAALKHLSVLY